MTDKKPRNEVANQDADKMLRNAVRNPNGKAVSLQGDESGNLYIVDKPLNNKELTDEPFTLERGERKLFNIHSGAKTVSFLGKTNISRGSIDVAFSSLIDNSALPYQYTENTIENNRFETDSFIAKSGQIRVTLRNNSNNPITVEKLHIIENVGVDLIDKPFNDLYSTDFSFNDLFKVENGDVVGTVEHTRRLETGKFKNLLVYVDSNYDVDFDFHVYDSLPNGGIRGTASYDGEKFLFVNKEERQDYVKIPRVNDKSVLNRHVRFPIHDASELLKQVVGNLVIRFEANSTTNVKTEKRNELSFKINVIGVK